MIGKSLPTLIKGVSGSHNPPAFEAQRSRWHSFLSPIDVGPPPNPPPSGPSVFMSTPSVNNLMSTYPIWETASSLAHCPVSDSYIICKSPSSPLANIVLFSLFPFGLPLKDFKTHLLRKGFHTLIKGVSFSSPTDVGSRIAFLVHLPF